MGFHCKFILFLTTQNDDPVMQHLKMLVVQGMASRQQYAVQRRSMVVQLRLLPIWKQQIFNSYSDKHQFIACS